MESLQIVSSNFFYFVYRSNKGDDNSSYHCPLIVTINNYLLYMYNNLLYFQRLCYLFLNTFLLERVLLMHLLNINILLFIISIILYQYIFIIIASDYLFIVDPRIFLMFSQCFAWLFIIVFWLFYDFSLLLLTYLLLFVHISIVMLILYTWRLPLLLLCIIIYIAVNCFMDVNLVSVYLFIYLAMVNWDYCKLANCHITCTIKYQLVL